jgi:transcriptional regulator of arginine metabolism
MKGMREQRQQAIAEVVADQVVGTQQALRSALRQKGIQVDQSTLSRDLHELGIRKAGGRYIQSVGSEAGSGNGREEGGEVDYRGVVRSFVPCGPHQIVIRTAVGQAQPVALAIDANADPSIVATLAGDDTIFVATRNRKTQTVALRRLVAWFGDKRER